MSLEVDGRGQNFPIPVPRADEADKFLHQVTLTPQPFPSEPYAQDIRYRRIAKLAPFLVIALVLMTGLAAVSAGLAGFYAKKRNSIAECTDLRK